MTCDYQVDVRSFQDNAESWLAWWLADNFNSSLRSRFRISSVQMPQYHLPYVEMRFPINIDRSKRIGLSKGPPSAYTPTPTRTPRVRVHFSTNHITGILPRDLMSQSLYKFGRITDSATTTIFKFAQLLKEGFNGPDVVYPIQI